MRKKLENQLKESALKYKSELNSEELVFKGNFLSVYRNKYEISGKEIEREIGTKKIDQAVAIIPVTNDGNIVVVIQPRVAIKEQIDVELPAGYVEIGETPCETAYRELIEETGYVSKECILLDTYYSAEGASGEQLHIVLALGCKKKETQHLDKDEFIDFYEVSLDDIYDMIDERYILGASTRIAIFNYERYLNNQNMNLGVKEARKTMNNDVGGPFGAVIVDEDNNIISIASNTVLGSHDPTAHAEINAIRKASRKIGNHDLSRYTLYATGYPCPMCLSAIIWANIKKVYYGTSLDDADKIGFRDDDIYDFIRNNNVNVLDLEQINRDECLKLFNEYDKKDKEIY